MLNTTQDTRRRFAVTGAGRGNKRSTSMALGLGVLMALSAAPAMAATYYVDINGSDASARDGSSGQPWRTLKYAASRVAADSGHVIRVNSGTFVEAGPINIATGITVEGSGQTGTVLRNSNTGDYLLKLNSGSLSNGNQQIRNLTIDGNSRANAGGIQANMRSNVKILNVRFDNLNNDAVNMRGAGWNQGRNNRVSGLEIGNCVFNNSGSHNTGGFKSGVIVIGTSNGSIIRDVNINCPSVSTHGIKYDWNAAGNEGSGGWNFGLKIYNANISTAGDSFSIELFNSYNGCEIYNSSVNKMISMGGQKDTTLNGDGVIDMRVHHNRISGDALECQGSDMEFDHNYVYNSGDWGVAIWNAGDAGARRNYFIHDNVFEGASNATSEALRIQTTQGALNFHFYNNTLYNLSRGVLLFTQTSDHLIRDVNIKNNVFRDMRRGSVEIYRQNNAGSFDNISLVNNVHFGGAALDMYGNVSSVTNLTRTNQWINDPGLNMSGGKPTPFYLPASSSSFVVNRGTTAIPSRSTNRAFSGNPDLGAYELGTSTGTTVPIGKIIGWKALNNDRFVSTNLNNSNYLQAGWATSIGSWERYRVVDAGGGKIALLSLNNNRYVSCNLNNSNYIQAGWATTIGAWEKFTWIDRGSGKFALLADNNARYISNNLNASQTLQAFSTSIGTWEEFQWQETQ
jgi:hypothetical protein